MSETRSGPSWTCCQSIELVHNVEAEIVDEIADAGRNDNRLIGRDFAQRPAIEMIEMRVGHEDQVDLGQVIDLQPGTFQAFDHFQPHRPVRIDQDVDAFEFGSGTKRARSR